MRDPLSFARRRGQRRVLVLAGSGALATWLAGCGSHPGATRDPPSHVASASCPLKTPADWQRFITTTTDDESWVTTCSDLDNCDALLGVFARHVQTDVIDVLSRCAVDLADNPPIAACTAPLRRFVPAWMKQHAGDSYGFRLDNASYLAAQTAFGEPSGMMSPPDELLASLPVRSQIEEAARTHGWPYLIHDSCLGGVRIFLNVPDPEDRFDRWILVGLDAEAKVVISPAIMSFIGVQKKDGNGRSLERVRLHFRDYIVTAAEGSWTLALPPQLGGKCYACHGSGMRQLLSTRGSVTASAPVRGEAGYGQPDVGKDFGFERLASLNQRLASYGLPDWNGTLDPADHGPPLGRPLGCTSCHDGVSRGVLSVSTSEGMLGQKIVEQLSMRSPGGGKVVPDERAMALLERDKQGNPPLSPDEQIELEQARAEHLANYRAVIADRFPAWRAWVLTDACE